MDPADPPKDETDIARALGLGAIRHARAGRGTSNPGANKAHVVANAEGRQADRSSSRGRKRAQTRAQLLEQAVPEIEKRHAAKPGDREERAETRANLLEQAEPDAKNKPQNKPETSPARKPKTREDKAETRANLLEVAVQMETPKKPVRHQVGNPAFATVAEKKDFMKDRETAGACSYQPIDTITAVEFAPPSDLSDKLESIWSMAPPPTKKSAPMPKKSPWSHK